MERKSPKVSSARSSEPKENARRGSLKSDKQDKTLNASNQMNNSLTIYQFAKLRRCYDLMPTSSKLVVFDTQLHVKKAFHALVYNNVRAAPLWDNSKQKFVGILTITDFIRILICYYKSQMEQLEEQRIQTWRDVLTYRDNFIHISPDASIYDAVKVLIDQRIHRLPMVHPVTGNVLCILTHKRLLKYLYLSDTARPPFMEQSIGQLGIGTHSDIVTVSPTTTVIEALNLFIQHTVSAFPVVDPVSGRCVDIYSKFDVIHLAADRSYDQLDMTIMKALERRKFNQNMPVADSPSDSSQNGENNSASGSNTNNQNSANSSAKNKTFTYSVVNCKLTDTLNYVVDVIAKAEVHRLVIVDDFQRVIGMVSLSDILDYLILKQPAAAMKRSSCHGSSSSVESFEMLPQCQKF